MATDAKAGKRTLGVRLGAGAGRAEHVLLMALAFATPVVLCALGLAGPACRLALLGVPVAIPPLRCVLRESGAALNPALGGIARLQLVYGLLLAIGLWI